MLKVALCVALLGCVAAPTAASATYPGANGRIAFVQSQSDDSGATDDLYSIEPDGSGVVRLTNLSQYIGRPSWSADGQRITFGATVGREGGSWIYTTRADGTAQTRVVHVGISDIDDALDIAPVFTPDGGRIVYATRKAIRSIRVDGTDGRVLFRAPEDSSGRRCCVTDPTVSPSGKRIAFALHASRPKDSGIWAMSPKGKKLQQLVKDTERRQAHSPDFSPDGDHLYFGRDRKHYYMRLDRGRSEKIPGMPVGAIQATLSPSGEQIVATDINSDPDFLNSCGDLFTKPLAGSERVQVTHNCNGPFGISAHSPSWQPVH